MAPLCQTYVGTPSVSPATVLVPGDAIYCSKSRPLRPQGWFAPPFAVRDAEQSPAQPFLGAIVAILLKWGVMCQRLVHTSQLALAIMFARQNTSWPSRL